MIDDCGHLQVVLRAGSTDVLIATCPFVSKALQDDAQANLPSCPCYNVNAGRASTLRFADNLHRHGDCMFHGPRCRGLLKTCYTGSPPSWSHMTARRAQGEATTSPVWPPPVTGGRHRFLVKPGSITLEWSQLRPGLATLPVQGEPRTVAPPGAGLQQFCAAVCSQSGATWP